MFKTLLPALAALACGSALAAAAPTPFEADGMARILASEAGRPFVLLIWSLDCSYCQASIGKLVAERQQGGGPDIVTLSTDTLAQPGNAEAIRARLKQLGIHGASWAFGDTPAAQLRYAIDPKWHGETPRTYWYNSRGERIAAHSGLISSATPP